MQGLIDLSCGNRYKTKSRTAGKDKCRAGSIDKRGPGNVREIINRFITGSGDVSYAESEVGHEEGCETKVKGIAWKL
jgi:hypothetical protein